MDSSVDGDTSLEDYLSFNSSYTQKGDLNISEHIADFQRMRISALTKAAEMSPHVKEVTIGPNSTLRHEEPEELSETEPEKEEYISEEALIADKVREDLRFTLIMKEYETKLQEASETIFKSLLENMIEKRAETRCREKQLEENKKKISEMRKLQLQKEMFANDNLSILETAKLEQQKHQILNRQRVENMNRVLEEQNKAARFAAITDSHTKICICYNQITEIFDTEPVTTELYNKYVPAIDAVVSNIGTIMDMCNTHLTTDKEVKQAEVLAANLENVRVKIVEELEAIKQEKVKKEEEEKLLKQKEQEKKKAEEKKAAEQQAIVQTQQPIMQTQQPSTSQSQQQVSGQAQRNPPVFHSSKNYNYYIELKNVLSQYEALYKDLLENPNLKKFRFDCQKAVNTPVNAISSVSGMHMKDKYDKLSKLLKGERVQVLDTYVAASQHPQGVAYCTALLAKKIVRQGDLLVSSNPEAAFPLAAITVALWSQFPEFGRLLEAYFHQLCPYLVPMFLPQKQGQSDKEFYLSRGYTYSDTGAVEKQDKFLKRMSGIFRLRCAIWIAKMPKFLNAQNPHSLQFGWQWLASFINLKPEPDICATLLYDFFTVCGSEFLKHYGRQFIKIIKLISSEYLGVLQNIDEGGPKTRLEVFLQNVLRTGHIEPPTGLLAPNVW